VAQLAWLVSQGASTRIVQLTDGLHEVVRMLSAFPVAGPKVAESGSVLLRKLIFPKGPFVAWYLYDAAEPDGELWLVRLFHARQKRSNPAQTIRRARRAL